MRQKEINLGAGGGGVVIITGESVILTNSVKPGAGRDYLRFYCVAYNEPRRRDPVFFLIINLGLAQYLADSMFIFRLHHVTCGISVPPPRIKPMPLALEAWSLNHWTSGEVPQQVFVVRVNEQENA